jgi:hypothetical protein
MKKIFVQIASYRDAELRHTIDSCLKQARHPERLTFGICWQYDEVTFTDLDIYQTDSRFRIDQVYYRDSQGCCWARNRTNRLYQNEEYTLQIDAHSRFTKNWDNICIDMLESIDYNKPVLTTYPAPYSHVDGKEILHVDRGIQRLKVDKFRKNLTIRQSTIAVDDVISPGKSPLIAAGLIFTLGEFCREVEYDPEMYFLGEEISLAARAYTAGYNFYYPNKDLIWHFYQHKMPLHWTDHQNIQSESNSRAMGRLQALLLGNHGSLGCYGLGKSRTLKQFEEYVELDFQGRFNRQREPVRFCRDYLYWIFCLLDDDDDELYRYDISDEDILFKRKDNLKVDAELIDKPSSYMLWPFSSKDGYLNKRVYEIS